MFSGFSNFSVWLITVGCSGLIAVAAYVATAGWAELSTRSVRVELQAIDDQRRASQRQDILSALSRELVLNSAQLTMEVFRDSTEAELSVFRLYPTLQKDAAAAAVSSGVFTSSEKSPILSTLFYQLAAIDIYNNAVRQAHDRLNIHSQAPDLSRYRERVAQTRRSLHSSNSLAAVKAAFADLRELLEAEGVNFEELTFDFEINLTDHWSDTFENQGPR